MIPAESTAHKEPIQDHRPAPLRLIRTREAAAGQLLSRTFARLGFGTYVALWRLIGRHIRRGPQGCSGRFPVFHGDKVFRFEVDDIYEHIARKLWRRRMFYERRMLDDIAARLTMGSVAIDVGANIGNHTVFLAGVCGSSVVAIEPYPPAFSMLRRNVTANRLDHAVRIEACALGAHGGFGEIEASPENIAAATIRKADGGQIPIRTLDDLLGDMVVGLIKIDVEGMESEVIRGGKRIIERCQPLLYLECKSVDAAEEVFQELRPLGYVPLACFNATPTILFAPSAVAFAELIATRKQ